MTQLPKFTAALLHPRYWLTWLGIGFLWLLVQLPYPVIFRLGKYLGRFAQLFMKRRARIALHDSRKAAGAGLAQGTPDTGRLLKTKPRSPQHSPAGSTALQ